MNLTDTDDVHSPTRANSAFEAYFLKEANDDENNDTVNEQYEMKNDDEESKSFFQDAVDDKKYGTNIDEIPPFLALSRGSNLSVDIGTYINECIMQLGYVIETDVFTVISDFLKAVVKLEVKVGRKIYCGTGTVVMVDNQHFILTNKHVIRIVGANPQPTKARVTNYLRNVAYLVDIQDLRVSRHDDFVMIPVDMGNVSEVPAICTEIWTDNVTNMLRNFPSSEKRNDTALVQVVVGHPLGCQKPRLSLNIERSRNSVLESGTCYHNAPTFGGSSGSLVFLIPIGRGQGKFSSENVTKYLREVSFIGGIHFQHDPNKNKNMYITFHEMFHTGSK